MARFRCEFAIPSDTRYLALLRGWVDAAARQGGVPQRSSAVVLAASVALTEAVSNAIVHAHRRRRSLPIRIALAVAPSAIVLEVIDRGRGIGDVPASEPEPLATRGRGLFIIRRVTARMTSERIAGGHRLRMVFHL
jgi:anti-sigma regulatory factor (Ser/Thr protein kinase)